MSPAPAKLQQYDGLRHIAVRIGVLVGLLCGVGTCTVPDAVFAAGAGGRAQAKVHVLGKTFHLDEPDGFARLIDAIDARLEDQESAPKGAKGKKAGAETSTEAEKSGALTFMKTLAVEADQSSEGRTEAIAQIREIADSLRLREKYPIPKRVDLVQAPFLYHDLMHNPVAVGKHKAGDLPDAETRVEDPSLLDPIASTFWSRPEEIAGRDLYHAFGPILTLGEQVCTYDAPKTSYGTSPGFSMQCGDETIKVKFGETENTKRNSEVAVTRIFGALGYNVEPNDYAPEIRVRYDRKILLEFNSRKALNTRITALGFIPVRTVRLQTVENPFHFIRSAVMRNGEVLTPEALAQKLIRPEILEKANRHDKRFAPGASEKDYTDGVERVEQEIDYLVMEEANIQRKAAGGRNIGPWDWNALDHPTKRELRGAGLLAAWTNYFDTRWDNNRLKLVEAGGHEDLRHFISDLGNSLGRAENFKVDAQGLVNDFPWTFTEKSKAGGDGHGRPPFRIVGYQPMFENRAFRDMTLDDARWMARLIAQMTENQLKQVLIATGFTSAEVKLYTEKLISRRDAMIRDVGLESEIPLLRPEGSDRSFSYDPTTDGPVTARAGDGSELRPFDSRDLVVRNGRVEPR